MSPVMASTSIDKWAIDLAGVDAGAKMLVGLAGSLAAAEAADKRAIITLRQDTRNFENLIRRIDASLDSVFQPQNDFSLWLQARYQTDDNDDNSVRDALR